MSTSSERFALELQGSAVGFLATFLAAARAASGLSRLADFSALPCLGGVLLAPGLFPRGGLSFVRGGARPFVPLWDAVEGSWPRLLIRFRSLVFCF